MFEVGFRKAGCFSIDAELMKAREVAAFGVAHIESGRQGPIAFTIHDESEVFDVIVLIAADQIEDDARRCARVLVPCPDAARRFSAPSIFKEAG